MKIAVALSETPLAEEWRALSATILRRGQVPEELPPVVRTEGYAPETVAVAQRGWLRRMVEEHQSATVFSGLLPQLMEAEMPLDMQGVVLRMAMDELRHGALSGAVAGALGAAAVAEISGASERPAAHEGCSPLVRVLRNVVYVSCVSETVSVALTAAERDAVDEPFIGAVLDQLLGDETLHARFGWICVGYGAHRLSAEDRRALEAYVPVALGHFESAIRSRIGPHRPISDAAERARLGVLDPELAHDVLGDTLRNVVVPRLRDAGLQID